MRRLCAVELDGREILACARCVPHGPRSAPCATPVREWSEHSGSPREFATLVAIADALGIHVAELVDNRLDELTVLALSTRTRAGEPQGEHDS